MKYLKSTLILCFLFAFQFVNAQWNKGKGNGYYKLSAWSLVADQHYTSTGDIDPNATRGNFTLSLYGEYGLTNKLDVITYLPFFTRIYQNAQVSGTNGSVIQEGEAVNAVGDIDVGIRYGLLKRNHFALSTTLKLGLPTGKDKAGSDGSYQTGDGEFNQLITVDAGTSYQLFHKPAYTKAYVGFNNRTQGFSDEFHYGIESGIKLWSKLWVLGRINSINSFKNGTLSAQNAQGSIFANNIEYISVGGEVAYYITSKLGVSLNYTSAVSGRIIYARPSISAGVFLDIQ
ncbi:hypothetical protein AXE80_10040 [Wenyingzhuangia fucanilytica]|uniref:Transporter n=1 Tax=Wenyingzhuangia fucanilytica TaxID=1790137 RepID=A0A1B1Y776_9FLAO|nr:hypothetical protein [Wenyingzhuangia fucanilytica]ANW96597.1 hypothetical protein AXE80_10040 [Wenyingzhuangia fucanilytica]